MSATTGVLALVSDVPTRDDVDRVSAAVGLPVVHAGEPSSRKVWAAAVAVVLDVQAARRCADRRLPRRGHVVLLGRTPPQAEDFRLAISVGAQHVMTLPGQEGELVAELSGAAEASRDDTHLGSVVAVIAGRGGAGASTFAASLALRAADPLLIDVDPWSGGIDLLLGGEAQGGLRWPDLTLQGGRLTLAALREALPRHRGISVLSSARVHAEIDAAPLEAVIEAGRRGGATVICDVPRRSTAAVETALDAADLVALIASADVRGCAASAALAPSISGINPNTGLIVRGPAPGGLRSVDVARIVGLPLLAAMRSQPGLASALEHGGLRLRRWSPLAAAARRVLAVLHQHPRLEDA